MAGGGVQCQMLSEVGAPLLLEPVCQLRLPHTCCRPPRPVQQEPRPSRSTAHYLHCCQQAGEAGAGLPGSAAPPLHCCISLFTAPSQPAPPQPHRRTGLPRITIGASGARRGRGRGGGAAGAGRTLRPRVSEISAQLWLLVWLRDECVTAV